MAEAVAQAIQQRRHLVVEAGTGVGKSFAYLVPAILDAAGPRAEGAPRRRVVISTHTISLQEQLLDKDIPFLASVDPAGVHRRAGQGPRQLPQPAAAAECPGPGGGPVHRRSRSSTISARSTPGRSRPATARFRTSISAPSARCGTKWPATMATAWAGRAPRTTTVSTTGPGGGSPTPRS